MWGSPGAKEITVRTKSLVDFRFPQFLHEYENDIPTRAEPDENTSGSTLNTTVLF